MVSTEYRAVVEDGGRYGMIYNNMDVNMTAAASKRPCTVVHRHKAQLYQKR